MHVGRAKSHAYSSQLAKGTAIISPSPSISKRGFRRYCFNNDGCCAYENFSSFSLMRIAVAAHIYMQRRPNYFFSYLIVSWQQRAVSFISNKRQPVLYLELLYIRIVMYYDEFANAGNVVHACRGQERRRQRKRAEMSVRHYCVGIDTQKYLSAA